MSVSAEMIKALREKSGAGVMEFRNALHCFPVPPSGLRPAVLTCSAKEGTGITEIWQAVNNFVLHVKQNGYFRKKREEQAVIRMHDFIKDYLENSFYSNEEIRSCISQVEEMLRREEITSYRAAYILLNKFFKR